MAEQGGGDGKPGAASKKRKRAEFIYGNYMHYYGYRVGRALEEDPRVSVFREDWIRGKDCLDIGCNEGHVTIAVAVKYGCKSMLGVDIDSKLVFKARQNLRLELEALQGGSLENGKSEVKAGRVEEDKADAAERSIADPGPENGVPSRVEEGKAGLAAVRNGHDAAEKLVADPGHVLRRVKEDKAGFAASRDGDDVAERSIADPGPENDRVEEGKAGLAAVRNGDGAAEKSVADPGDTKKAVSGGADQNGTSQEKANGVQGNEAVLTLEEHKSLLGRVTFRTQNYLEVPVRRGSYDTIFCLSVSKWIHLNWGDNGLIDFFSKIFKELRDGGVLILEPQPWKSYAKKRKISEVASKNFKAAVLRPENFPALLTEKIGFRSFEEISSELPSDKDGFKRPLFAYYK